MEKEKENEKDRKKNTLFQKSNSEEPIFYPWEGGGTLLEIVSSSSDENAACNK